MSLTFIGRNGLVMHRDGPRFIRWKRRRLYTRLEEERAFNTGTLGRNLRRFGIKARVRDMLATQQPAHGEKE